MPQSNSQRSAQCDIGYRSLEVRAATFNEESRTVEATISTEQPVAMPDWSRMEMIPEVLLASGADYPKSRQVPFLDSHARSSIKDQLGSARDIKANKRDITATLHFSRAVHAEDALVSVRDGHITDVSVGYEVIKRTFVDAGKTKTIGGREFSGPVNVVTKWRLREVSLTPIGADDQAKLRGLDPAAIKFQSSDIEREFTMNEELRTLLESRGMQAELSDADAQRWLIDNADKLGKDPQRSASESKPDAKTEARSGDAITAESIQKMIFEATRAAITEQQAARAAFEKEIDSLCELAGLPEVAAECRNLSDVAAARDLLKKRQSEQTERLPYGSVRVLSSGVDALKDDIRSALSLKAISQAANGNTAVIDKHLPSDKRSKNADNFRHATLLDMATEYVRAQGVQTLGMTREQIAICAMFGPEKAGVRMSGAYHNTGSFANLTLDAINKSMMVGYTEVPATWRGPMRQGESVADFKQINRMRLGGVPNLPVWNDTNAPERASMADAKESYAVEARSVGVDFGYKLIVNDDMSALTRVPLSLGDAAARTVNAVAWSQVTSNPVMSDGVALFSAATGARKRANLTTGSATPTVATNGAMTALMRQMRGENTPEGAESHDILNLSPAYIVGPASLETTILQLINSAYDPDSGKNSMVFNPSRTLVPIVEPLLDANSATAWYLFASPTRIDTVEVTFLQGQETPVVRSVMDEHTLAMTYYVLQSVGAKPLNHRGIQKHAGA